MALNNVLTSYIELCDAYVKFKQTNQSCPPSKLANQSMLYGALLIHRVTILLVKSRKTLPFGQRNIEIRAVKNIFPLDFAKYLKRRATLLMIRSDFRKKGVCSKCFRKTLCGYKVLVSECIFKLVCHCESCRRSEICMH